MTPTYPPTTFELVAQLRQQAADQNAAYPQYAGHWDGPEWRLGRIARRVRTKMGVAFERGDYALFRSSAHDTSGAFVTAYSWRNEIDTSIPANVIGVVR